MDSPVPDPQGLRTYEEILGKPFEKPLTGLREPTINHLFAHVWNRPHLSQRERRLITIALLAAQGRPDQLRDHIRGARKRGIPRDDILETMVQVGHYAGWASGMSGQVVAEAVFEEPA
ncbi:MAG: carboxymuconolactone decarboxylase family protein [Longimicrobiales bacterium]